jgi:putative oxidoreductase
MNLGFHLGIFILRISTAVMMLLHGINKIAKGISFIKTTLIEIGWPGWFAFSVYIGEVVAPLLLIIGWRSRIAALLVAVTMVFATFLVHMEDIFTLGSYGEWAIELQALYFFAAITLVFTGGGKFAISKSSFWD